MADQTDRSHVRLAELVGALSLGIDLGFGQPMEHVLRQCLIALRLAERMGLDDEQRGTVYYAAQLLNVGCHSDAHEQAKWFGDDIALKSTKYDYEPRSVAGAAAGVRMFGSGRPPLHRFRLGLEFALSGRHEIENMVSHHAAIARTLGEQLGLSDGILEALASSYEQWDGRGWPDGLSGEDVPIAARLGQVAEFTEVAHRVGGVDAAREMARKRSGKQFDPAVAGLIVDDAEMLFADLDGAQTWDLVIGAEPALTVMLSGADFDAALLAIANFIDLKSPYFLGHAHAVGELAAAAAASLGLGEAEVRTMWRAGLVHDFGRLGVSNSIWDKRGMLGPGEWERVRGQPYLTARMLQRSEALAPLGAVALAHRERLDGSGYPGGLVGPSIPRSARILAAADAYQAMREPRPHRPALSAEAAAGEMRQEVTAGRLEADAVAAVLGAAGHRVSRRSGGPAGLTAREVEVLRHLARGLSNKEIAEVLVISPKTVGNHVEHIYSKIDATTRARASLYAMQHGLLPEEEFAAPAPV